MAKKEEPKVDEKVEKLKIKKPKVKKFKQQEEKVVKVDLKELAKKAEDITKVDVSKPVEEIKVPEEKVDTKEEVPTLQEITDEVVEVEKVAEVVEKEIIESIETGKELPQNVQKLMNFMEDTGGDLNDYVKLNRDYSEMDNQTLLKEYYKTTKPHLQADEIDFLMEDQFSFDEDVDEERDIKRKKLALKEQVASAKTQLEEHKSKYYEEIKAGSRLTPEAKKAMDFFNRHNKESESTKKIHQEAKNRFLNKTEEVFNDEFKGFEYKVGDKKYRFNVKDPSQVKESQSDINNFVKKFLNEKNQMEDATGYHKSMFTAMNSDAIANHFYEQGKADALKESMAKSKNINMAPRQSHGGTTVDGVTMRVMDSDSGATFKIKKSK
tara:strand:- start:717 stop:1856 length:1140 start_codon:yes stop_codon:yes gene_type:complete